jgi:DHA1 family tetracycline resistance protein-like MFS transporter
MVCEAIGLLLIGSIVIVHSAVPLLVGTIIFAMGDGLFGPSFNGLLARGVDASQQGQVQGGNQAVQSLAHIIGPLASGELYDQLGHGTPYMAGAVIAVLAIGVISMALPALNRIAKQTESTPA